MCILSIVRNEGSFILTHNRDEDVARITSTTLITKKIEGIVATFPLDMLSQGTWILTSPLWTTAILNGAFKPHTRILPYRHSRGVLPYMLLKYKDALLYKEELDLNNIEPFTQVILNYTSQELFTLVWDGNKKHFTSIDDKLYVLSSSTLYDESSKVANKSAITSLKNTNPDELARIHTELSWKHRPEKPMLKTTSQVQIISNTKKKSMKFTKFVNEL